MGTNRLPDFLYMLKQRGDLRAYHFIANIILEITPNQDLLKRLRMSKYFPEYFAMLIDFLNLAGVCSTGLINLLKSALHSVSVVRYNKYSYSSSYRRFLNLRT